MVEKEKKRKVVKRGVRGDEHKAGSVFLNDTATTVIDTLSLHGALAICVGARSFGGRTVPLHFCPCDRGVVLGGFPGHNLDAGHVHGDAFVVEPDVLFGDVDVHEAGLAQPSQVDVPMLGPGDA